MTKPMAKFTRAVPARARRRKEWRAKSCARLVPRRSGSDKSPRPSFCRRRARIRSRGGLATGANAEQSLRLPLGPDLARASARDDRHQRRQREHAGLSRRRRHLRHRARQGGRRQRRLRQRRATAIISRAGGRADHRPAIRSTSPCRATAGSPCSRTARPSTRATGACRWPRPAAWSRITGAPVLDAGGAPIQLDPAAGPPDHRARRHDHAGRPAGRRHRPVRARPGRQADARRHLRLHPRQAGRSRCSTSPPTASCRASIEGANVDPVTRDDQADRGHAHFRRRHQRRHADRELADDAIKTLGGAA